MIGRTVRRLLDWWNPERVVERAQIRALWREHNRKIAEDVWKAVQDMECPHCHRPIDSYSLENDYLCNIHGFVNPVRKSDGARINGDGQCGPITEIGGQA